MNKEQLTTKFLKERRLDDDIIADSGDMYEHKTINYYQSDLLNDFTNEILEKIKQRILTNRLAGIESREDEIDIINDYLEKL